MLFFPRVFSSELLWMQHREVCEVTYFSLSGSAESTPNLIFVNFFLIAARAKERERESGVVHGKWILILKCLPGHRDGKKRKTMLTG